MEPVASGTNHYAIVGKCDILAHPGFISVDDVKLALTNGVRLEITTRGGHSYTNGYVAKIAKEQGAKLIIDTDSHSPYDLCSREEATKIAMGAGLSVKDVNDIFNSTEEWIKESIL